MRAFRDLMFHDSPPAPAGYHQCSLLAFLLWLLAAGCVSPLLAAQKTPSAREQKKSRTPPANIKLVVRDVVVDVVVTGRKGLPVTGLEKQNFKILDDGKPQRIQAFIVHQGIPVAQSGLPKLPVLPSNVFTDYSAVPPDTPLNVILLDLGNTPITNVPPIRRQILQFLREQPLGARYAVFVMGDGLLRMVQGFTSDRDRLIAAIDNNKLFSLLYEPSVDPFQIHPTLGATPGVGGYLPFRYQVATRLGRLGEEGGDLGTASENDWLLESEGLLGILPPHTGMKSGKRFHWINTQVRNTVNELSKLALLLSGLPGRKNLLWFTGSLPLDMDNFLHISRDNQRGSILAASDLVIVHNSPKIVQAAELLERSRTAVYAIDSHGLETGSADPRWVKQKMSEHSALDLVSEITGGHAFYNTNGFKQAMATATNEGANYYTLTYIPANAKFRGELRHIRVELRGRDKHFHLAYRHSYFANSSDAAPETLPSPLAYTLQHGAPTAHQILFWASVDPLGSPQAEDPSMTDSLAGRKPARGKNGKARAGNAKPRMFQMYSIHYVLVAHMLDMAKVGHGRLRTKLEFATRAFDKNGLALRTIFNGVQATLTPEAYKRIEEKGLAVPVAVAVPVETKFLRLAVRDDLSNHVGSLELSLPLNKATQPQKK